MKSFFFNLFLLVIALFVSGASTFAQPLPAGTYTVGTGGYFTTIQASFNKLSTDGIAGNVTLELIDNLYTAPTDSFGFKLNGPISGVGPNSRVTIKPAAIKNVTIEGSGRATLSFLNTRYVTIDGVGITGPTTLTIRSLVEGQFTWINSMVFFPPAAHNIVENITFNNENYLKGVGLAFMSFVSTTSPLDSNLIQNNYIKNASIGIYISGWSGIAEARYNVVRGNIIGSEADSLITWGIQIEGNDNTIIENNRIENINQQFQLNVITHGVNIYGGNSCIIRNNVVHNVKSKLKYGSTGILLSGDGTLGYGTDHIVYNNIIYNIQSTSVDPSSRVAGIQLWYQQNPKIYYNSVYLSGRGGKNPFGSAALFTTWLGTVTNLDAKNNIFVNSRDDSPYCASTIRDYALTAFASDYNNLFYEPNQNNCLVRIGDTDYLTLAEWQATGKDLHSVTEMPNFILPDLHIESHMSTSIDGNATPINGITTDFDNQTRNEEWPDIGADEFDVSITYFQLSTDVSNGWNMVSIPGLHPVDQNVNTWWAYRDQSANVFKYSNGYQSVTTATPRIGYWMKHAGIRTYNTGDEWPAGGIQTVTHSPVAGNTGWNLIGGYELNATAADVTTNPPGLQSGPIYAYSGGYQIATTIDPGYGYWIKLSGAGQIILPESLAKSEPVEYFSKDWGRIILTDASGVSYTLYAVNGQVDLSEYDLPPVPPVGIFDIRYASGRAAENLSTDSKIIEMQGITYPITIKTEGVMITLRDEIGEIVNSILNPGYELTINNSSVNRLIILSGEVEKNIPRVYLLEQNYPNPFNPSTVISWQSPVSSKQTIKVFDILGNEVAILVDEYREAGNYQIEFNASELASGIYFYQLTAGDFRSVKKMIFMK